MWWGPADGSSANARRNLSEPTVNRGLASERMSTSFDLTGKTALVTGAKRGIGRAIAVALAHHGADIIGVSASQEAEGSEVGRLVEAEGRSFTGRACDFSSRKGTHDLIDWFAGQNRRVDILVNNAGTSTVAPALDQTDEDWDRVLEVNLSAPFILARELAKPMIEAGRGKVIFTSSILGFRGGANVAGYTATKTALVGLTKALANEWARFGVNVNAIAPGYVATDITKPIQDDPERYAAVLDRIPAGRWATPEDIAGAAVFLASDAANYVHGTVLAVDGGWLGR